VGEFQQGWKTKDPEEIVTDNTGGNEAESR
jgi:hypothetical protein